MTDERDDYLWDKSGARDAEVERLERLLARYRYDPARDDAEWLRRKRRPWLRGLLVAAGLLIGLALVRALLPRDDTAGYAVTGVAGLERIGVGERLETRSSTALVRVASLGDVRVEPSSSLRVDDDGERAHKLFLERGALHAKISARPGHFQVGTPAGLSIDLGCEYDLAVDDGGATTMTVTHGRVAFEAAGRRVVVPAHATCAASREGGPNVPVRLAAAPEFVAAVRALEVSKVAPAHDVEVVLAADVRDESVTLFHLFQVAEAPELRTPLFERLSKVYPLPDGTDANALLRGDTDALESWRERFERDWAWR